ncbi:hypothetical protein H5410_055731 [Solanum commersonii]|uniref:Uncharacterized protein n=1 Tax=Solanum commersonii TaxID=4109 RepID=A0A9J5WJK3_SOLCO|nr:hypothetical protein H5410_055731 [Solanum commersonii]
MAYKLTIYITLFASEENVVFLVGGNVLLREDEFLLKWTKQPQKMIKQLVILVPLQGVTLRNSLLWHQLVV